MYPGLQDKVLKEYTESLYIDGINGINSTVYPTGTVGSPALNKDNIKAIGLATGIKSYVVVDDVPGADNGDIGDEISVTSTGRHIFHYESVTAGSGPDGCIFENIRVLGGSLVKVNNTFRKCSFDNTGAVDTLGEDADLEDCDISWATRPKNRTRYVNCHFFTADADIDCISFSASDVVNILGGHGSFNVINLLVDATINIYGFEGDITLESSCVDGTINIFGVEGRVIDSTGVGCDVNTIETSTLAIGSAYSNQRMEDISYDDFGNPTTYTLKIYPTAADAQNDTNITKTFSVTQTYRKDPANTNRFELVSKIMVEV